MAKTKSGKKKRSSFIAEQRRGVAVGNRPTHPKSVSSKMGGGATRMKHIPRKTG